MRQATIIGCGPAGISTAIYLKRSNIDCLVIGKDFGALKDYPKTIENYYGFKDPISGNALISGGIDQAKRLGIEVITDDVIALFDRGSFFEIKTKSDTFTSKTVILATGKVRLTLDVPGFRTYKGKGVSMCAACDGYFYKKKKLAVIGSGAYMQNELNYLKRLTDDITVFTNGDTLTDTLDLPVIFEPLKALIGDQKVTHIETHLNKYPVDGVFLAIGAPSSLEFASQLGVIVEKGNVSVDENYQTNIPGLFAAGDIIGGKLQIAKAVYDGMNTADSVIKYLKLQTT
jgi:thioredoxin reductase (NADPH)